MTMSMIKFDQANNSTFLALPSEMISDGHILAHFKRNSILCTSESANTKLSKSYKLHPEYRTAYVALLPANYSGFNVCPNHAHCKAHCIGFSAGRNRFDASIMGKYLRTLYFSRFRTEFIAQLRREIINFDRLCLKTNRIGAIRLNAFSDIVWESIAPELFESAPNSVFYDYTKLLGRFDKPLPKNYRLTYSLVAAQHTFDDIHHIATIRKIRCSAVVSKPFYKELQSVFGMDGRFHASGVGGVSIEDGDKHDLTFLHRDGTVLILKEKSRLKGENPLTYSNSYDFGRLSKVGRQW